MRDYIQQRCTKQPRCCSHHVYKWPVRQSTSWSGTGVLMERASRYSDSNRHHHLQELQNTPERETKSFRCKRSAREQTLTQDHFEFRAMPTSPIEVLLQRDMEWRADDVTKFAADISSRVGDADTLVGAPSIKDVEVRSLAVGHKVLGRPC